MPKIKYEGPGLTTIGVDFQEGEYELSDKAAAYVLETFPSAFSVAGKTKEKPAEPVVDVEEKVSGPKPKASTK